MLPAYVCTQHANATTDEHGEDADFLEMGKAVGQILSERHYKWISHKGMFMVRTPTHAHTRTPPPTLLYAPLLTPRRSQETISEFFPPLPIDTVENQFRAVNKVPLLPPVCLHVPACLSGCLAVCLPVSSTVC
jgi:hypothetical protein